MRETFCPVNQPMPDQIYTLPKTQARFLSADIINATHALCNLLCASPYHTRYIVKHRKSSKIIATKLKLGRQNLVLGARA